MPAMAIVPRPAPVSPAAPPSPSGPVNPTGHLAQALPGFDPGPIINAHETNLADYLNQPVQDILARLGIHPAPAATPAPVPAAPGVGAPASPVSPASLINSSGGVVHSIGSLRMPTRTEDHSTTDCKASTSTTRSSPQCLSTPPSWTKACACSIHGPDVPRKCRLATVSATRAHWRSCTPLCSVRKSRAFACSMRTRLKRVRPAQIDGMTELGPPAVEELQALVRPGLRAAACGLTAPRRVLLRPFGRRRSARLRRPRVTHSSRLLMHQHALTSKCRTRTPLGAMDCRTKTVFKALRFGAKAFRCSGSLSISGGQG
jgi:hypothetical protein